MSQTQIIIHREKEAHIVYEDDTIIAILDGNPRALGHTLVIPKLVSRTFLEMNPDILGQYFTVVQKVAQAIKDSLHANGCNVIINIEEAGGQKVFHTHTHLIPRFTEDMLEDNPHLHVTYSSDDQAREYADMIKAQLG